MKRLLVMLTIILSIGGVCFAKVSVPDTIRVGIYSYANAVSSFTISSESGMEIGTVNAKGKYTHLTDIAPRETDSNSKRQYGK